MIFEEISYRYEIALVLFVILPMVLVARLPRPFVWPVVVLWLFSPVGLYVVLVISEFAARPDDSATNLGNAVVGFGILSAILIIPWLIVWGIALGIALLLRRKTHGRGPVDVTQLPVDELPEPVVQPAPPVAHDQARVDALYSSAMRIAAELNIEKRVLPFDVIPDNGAASAFADAAGYHLAFYDRGQEYERRTTQDLDEIIYWIFELATLQLASEVAARKLTHADEFGPLVLVGQGTMLASMPYDWHERWLTDPNTRAAFYRTQGEQL